MTNVRGIINDVIRDASAEIGTVGPQVISFPYSVSVLELVNDPGSSYESTHTYM